MAAYADYTFYTGTFLGTAIASSNFPRLALRASAEVDKITFNRAAPIVTAATDTATIDKIKMATCEIAEELKKQDDAGGSDGIVSESQGSYSVSFAANSSKTLSSQEKISKAARLWLSNTDLMFRGFADTEYGTP
jgi:hypothetical protein